MIAPVLEELDQEMGDKLKIVKIDVDENQETAGKYGVMSIPTLLVLKTEKSLKHLSVSNRKKLLKSL